MGNWASTVNIAMRWFLNVQMACSKHLHFLESEIVIFQSIKCHTQATKYVGEIWHNLVPTLCSSVSTASVGPEVLVILILRYSCEFLFVLTVSPLFLFEEQGQEFWKLGHNFCSHAFKLSSCCWTLFAISMNKGCLT